MDNFSSVFISLTYNRFMKEQETRHLYPEFYRRKKLSDEETKLLEQLRDELTVMKCEIHNSEYKLINNYKWQK